MRLSRFSHDIVIFCRLFSTIRSFPFTNSSGRKKIKLLFFWRRIVEVTKEVFTNKIKISFVHFRKPHQIRVAKNCSGLNGFSDPSWLLFEDEDVISFNFNKASFLSYSSLFSSQRASAAKLSTTIAARLRFFGVLRGSLGSHSTGNRLFSLWIWRTIWLHRTK